jgi:hypothetical protein
MARFDASEVRDQAAARAAAIAEKIEAFKSVGIEVPEHLQELSGGAPVKVETPVVEEPVDEPAVEPVDEPAPVEEPVAEPVVEEPNNWLDTDQDGPADPVVEESPVKRFPSKRTPKKPGS